MIAGYRTTGRMHPIFGICLLLVPLLAVAFTDAAGPATQQTPGAATRPPSAPEASSLTMTTTLGIAIPATEPAFSVPMTDRIPELRRKVQDIEIQLKSMDGTVGPNNPTRVQLQAMHDSYLKLYTQALAAQQARDSKPDEPTVDPETQGNAKQRALLAQRLPELHFDGSKFTDVIEYLRDVTGANIFVNWFDLENAGFSKDATVTLRVRDVTFGKALDLILESVGANDALAYSVEGGVIEISTADRARRKIVLQTYDVSRLAKSDAEMETIKKLIVDSVDPTSWKDNGGVSGSIMQFKNKLVIGQTPTNHQKIVEILQSVSDKGDESVVGTATSSSQKTELVQGVQVPADMAKNIQQLWSETYSPRIIYVNGQAVNATSIQDDFRKDVEERIQERGGQH